MSVETGSEGVRIEEVDPDSPDARACLAAYYRELERRFDGGYDLSRSQAPERTSLVRPQGVFLVARVQDQVVGCVALRRSGDQEGEVKRLWTSPEARGRGVGGRLMQAVEAAARDLAISVLRLDTHSSMPQAIALYRRDGWREIARYNDDPHPELFFEKTLSSA